MSDARLYAAATERNREPILQLLQRILPNHGVILELASGTGEHAVFFARELAPRFWLPSDINRDALQSISAWKTDQQVDNLYEPVEINVCESQWRVEQQDYDIKAMVCINMIHISPWDACLGLMTGAERILPRGGILYLYGPYKRNHQHTAPSNWEFDQVLRAQNPAWGVRNLEDVIDIAKEHNLDLLEVVEMPANNLSVVFKRR